MIAKFEQYLHENFDITPNCKILVAVSGGVDSIVLLHLLTKLSFNCITAHCNFGLRGAESDADQFFVEETAKKLLSEFVTIKFDTETYALQNKLSIQEAARELRYQWFEKQRVELNCQYIAIAHNADDAVETFHINSMRGGGIKALRSIKPKNGKIIRPLLSFFRKEIEAYAINNNITWRTDSSNLKTKYLRNKLRLTVIPQFEAIKPSYKTKLFETILKLQDVEAIYNEYIRDAKKELFEEQNGEIRINIEKLRQKVSPKTLLYELIKPFGFTSKQSLQVFEQLSSNNKANFSSKSHLLIIERTYISITLVKTEPKNILIIPELTNRIKLSENTFLNFKLIKKKDFAPERTGKKAYFDANLIQFPLTIRYFAQGDRFSPFGMQGVKKLSDFFIDHKFSNHDKESTPLLISNQHIIWVINFRASNLYKVTEQTSDILEIEYTEN